MRLYLINPSNPLVSIVNVKAERVVPGIDQDRGGAELNDDISGSRKREV